MKKAYFAGGCFWCIAGAFVGRSGVLDVVEGYAGGDKINPTYLEVKSQSTNHRESICITYDETVVSYKQLVEILLDSVDPFDPDGQFIDKGFSYTLAIFYLDKTEQLVARSEVEKLEKACGKKVCLSILPYKNFFVAEGEHHNYAQNHPEEFQAEMEESGRNAYFHGKKK